MADEVSLLAERLARAGNDLDLMATARALASHGKGAASAASALAELLREGDDARAAAAAFVLSEVGAPALAQCPDLAGLLASTLSHGSAEVRHWAALTLARSGGHAKSAATALIRALRDDDDEGVRQLGAEALGSIGECSDECLDALFGALADQFETVRKAAARALAELASREESVTRRLVNALSDCRPDVRAHAAEALGRLGSLPEGTLPRLVQLLGDECGCVRAQAIAALAKIPVGDGGVVGRIAACLTDESAEVRRQSAKALRNMGEAASGTVPLLLAALGDPDESVRYCVIQALETLAPYCPSIRPAVSLAMSHCLLDKSRLVQVRAVEAFGRMGQAASGTDDREGSGAASWASWEQPSGEDCLHVLRTCLADADPSVRASAHIAMRALGNLGGEESCVIGEPGEETANTRPTDHEASSDGKGLGLDDSSGSEHQAPQ